MGESKNWYVVIDGKAEGPRTINEIQDELKAGKLSYSDLVFRPGFSRWMAVGECSEFERRNSDPAGTRLNTVSKMSIPGADDSLGGNWIILVKQITSEGKSNYAQSGPYATEVIQRKLAQGELKYTDHIWKKGFKNWETLANVPDFERRSLPKEDTEKQPKPAHDEDSGISQMATVVMTMPKDLMPIKEPEKIKPKDISFKPKDDDEEKKAEPLLDEDEAYPLKRINKRKALIAACGATLGIALTYAAISAYKENAPPEKRVVASVKPPPPVLVPPKPAPAAVNPEFENRTPKKPSILKVVSLKTSDHPQVVLETDLPGGTPLDIEVTAHSGSILQFPSFYLKKQVKVVNGQLPSVDFSQDNLPPGDYKLDVTGGALSTTAPFSVGVHDTAFQQRLAAFQKMIAAQRKVEKSKLDEGVHFIAKSYAGITQYYRKAHSSQGSAAKKKWAVMLKAWRQDFDKHSAILKNVNEKKRNYFVYPEALMKMKTVEQQLSDVAQLYDKSLKTGRSIASESDMNDVFAEHLQDLKETVRRLK